MSAHGSGAGFVYWHRAGAYPFGYRGARSRRCFLLFACMLCAAGCGAALAPAFDASFPDNDAQRSAAVVARLASGSVPAATSESLLVATTYGGQPEVLVYDVAQQRVRWRVALRAETRPELLGDLVVTSSDGHLIGLERSDGKLRFRAPIPGCGYLGAARDGERLFIACQTQAATGSASSGTAPALTPSGIAERVRGGASLQAIDARDGRALWQRSAHGEIGRPAARAGLVLVPWQRQSLALLDAASGRELARLRSRDDVIEWVRADARAVFFGYRTLYRLSAHGYDGSRDSAAHVVVPDESLPAASSASAMESAFAAQPGSRSARGRIALYVEPEAVGDDAMRIAYGRYYYVFYRYVFAYDAAGQLRWSKMLAHDAIAGQALEAGLALTLEDGELLLLAQDNGGLIAQQRVGASLGAATLQAPGLVASAAAAGDPADVALRHGLTEIALDTDTRLVPARAYAVQQLAKLDAADVTRELLDIYAQSATPPDLKRVVADALRTRRTGMEHLVDALMQRYDFLEQTRPAPLSVIVPALVDAHETRAVPHLIERLNDHETPLAALPMLIHAIVELGDGKVAAPLLAWLRLYRADSSLDEQPEAWAEAARGVLVHGGDEAPALLSSCVNDGRAAPALASAVAALLHAREQAHGAPEPALVAARVPEPSVQLPERLDQGAVNEVFAAHLDELRTCATEELARSPELGQVRIAFIAESDGETHALSFAPNTTELVDCLYPKVAAYRFPHFRSGRQVASYAFAARPRPAASSTSAEQPAQPWWSYYAAKAATATAPAAAPPASEPWWRSHQWIAPQLDATAMTAAPAPAPTAAPTPAQAPTTAPTPATPTAPPTAPAGAAPTAPAPASAAPHVPAPAQSAAPAADEAWWLPAAPAAKPPAAPTPTAPESSKP